MSRRILAIDDEAAIRVILKATLEFTAGWTVFVAESGKKGIEMAQRERPDAILLDVMMPDMEGPEVFRQLQAQPETQNIPVIFLTAQARAVERKALEALGPSVILKPFEPAAIAQQMSALLKWAE